MDNQRIKYNQELIKNKIRLEKQLKMVNKEIDENKKLCDHIRVCLGWDGPFQYRDTSFHTCLFCQKDDPDSQYRMIDATNYRKLKYSHGEYEMAREARLLEIHNERKSFHHRETISRRINGNNQSRCRKYQNY